MLNSYCSLLLINLKKYSSLKVTKIHLETNTEHTKFDTFTNVRGKFCHNEFRLIHQSNNVTGIKLRELSRISLLPLRTQLEFMFYEFLSSVAGFGNEILFCGSNKCRSTSLKPISVYVTTLDLSLKQYLERFMSGRGNLATDSFTDSKVNCFIDLTLCQTFIPQFYLK